MSSSANSVNFGKNYAVLNLDWMALLLNAVEESPEGQSLIANYSRWNNAPDLRLKTPFSKLLEPFGTFETGTPGVEIDPRFTVDEKDVVLRKARWSATTGNNLEQILKAQSIDTVVISGLSLSGVVMATVYRLFDLDFNIFVISDNVLEVPPTQHSEVSKITLETLMPKMNLQVITLDQALQALKQS
ncbi:cysteine hydrolase [Aspergillus melleus]|uniref:cysteine hydrolase n=1 Tax=Aspergillus melleus TaxID=138277 RepID=UPI001E8D03DB|nr:uncharacterized protein LDX57_007543 [Aspergillus melleus]KAH8429870.1 hypothetical protein LDX57_007543 [Aspergillus melleus]